MGQLNVAFWNVENLFEPAVSRRIGRGPRTRRAIDAKINQLADIIGGFFNGAGPDLLGLAEVATRDLFDELVDRIPGARPAALRLWEACVDASHTGLGLVGRDGVIARLDRIDAWRPTLASRPRALSAACTLVGNGLPIHVIANHWKSRIPDPPGSLGPTHHQDRRETADWVGTHLSLSSGMKCAIVMGDLNCQPDEEPLNGLTLRGSRHTSTAIRGRRAISTLYNTAWRLMTEPDPWRHPRTNAHRGTRPLSTFGASGTNVFDHLLVSKDAMCGRPLALIEDSLQYHPDGRAFRYARGGQIRPRPWRWHGSGSYSGASDHLPLLVTFST